MKLERILSILTLLLISTFFYVGKDKVKLTLDQEENIIDSNQAQITSLTPTTLNKVQRVPSSIPSSMNVKPSKEYLKRGNKILFGKNIEKYQDEDVELEFKNEYNRNWEKLLTRKVLRFQEEGTLAEITKELSYIEVKHNKGTYLETVKIKLTRPDGSSSTFKAKINPSNGRILQTWDRTQLEFNKENYSFRLED